MNVADYSLTCTTCSSDRSSSKLDPPSRLSADIGVIIAAVLSATPGDGANVCFRDASRRERLTAGAAAPSYA